VKFFFDTEFIEDGRTIDLISIGIVSEDGKEYYAESAEVNLMKANQWVEVNVLPFLTPGKEKPRAVIAREILNFIDNCAPKNFDGTPTRYFKPEFWAYYADYDWVALCQLYGTMMELPKGWPMYCRDIKQLCDSVGNPRLTKSQLEHNALADARWNKEQYEMLVGLVK
jgi:hypothetical protein